ncbi:MAG: hypothetical protein HZC44_09135, partial [Geobacter sp.]|nr:hypothetical protein [Geobacter sp.]
FNDEDYASYITKTLQEWAHYEHACEGPFLLERGYFSFLKAKEYLVAISSSGFQIIKSILNISPAAERYFVKFPERLVLLKDKYGLENLDLYANGSFVIARKP